MKDDSLEQHACDSGFGVSVIGPLRTSLTDNAERWDESKTLLENIHDTLGITLPSPKTSKKEVRVL